VRQETAFPESDNTKWVFSCAQPVEFELKLRWPSWAKSGYKLSVNGKSCGLSASPGEWVTVKRTWKSGDVVAVTMPFSLRTEGFADNPDRFAFLNGPVVLCAEVDPAKPFPAVVAGRDEVVKAIVKEKSPNRFQGNAKVFRSPGSAGGLTLEPFYSMHGGRPYQVYFDRFTPGQWKTREAEYAVEMARQRELNARTVDFVVPDREQSERDHKMQGERTGAGDFQDRKWRHATEGGWFSWHLKVLPDQPQELWVTYWGSDGGNRVFDVFVEGEKLATQRLENNRPNNFYDEVYQLPRKLLAGKSSITVKFQAHPNSSAGGVFGARIMKQTE
jgi:hypothetical protein